jgi:hypothetical protein
MKGLIFSLLASFALLFSGCTSKQYFEPEQTFSASKATTSYGGKMIDISRDGGTLEGSRYVGKAGISTLALGEGFRFINENETYILAANAQGVLKIIDKQSKKTVQETSLSAHIPVVSANIRGGIVAYVLNNNTFGIYKIADKSKLIESRSENTYAIDTRAASPMFIDNLVVVPMLDGKLIVVDAADTQNAKVVHISNEPSFNNVIYLSRIGDTMVAATPKRLITLGDVGKHEYNANVSEVAVDNGKMYLFTKEGEIFALDTRLKVLATQKFKFAHYAAAAAFGGKVYALEQQGSLIVLNGTLNKSKIYDVGEVEEPAFISGTKLYKDGDVIELSKLGYE